MVIHLTIMSSANVGKQWQFQKGILFKFPIVYSPYLCRLVSRNEMPALCWSLIKKGAGFLSQDARVTQGGRGCVKYCLSSDREAFLFEFKTVC